MIFKSFTGVPPEQTADPASYARAVLNILADFSEEKTRLADIQRAMLNILEDSSAEKLSLEDTQKAILNVLEDFDKERNNVEQANREMSREIAERKEAQEALRKTHDELEIRVQDRTAELAKMNRELQNEVSEHTRVEAELHRIEWMLSKDTKTTFPEERVNPFTPVYGDVTSLNTSRIILDSVGEKTLYDIASDYLDLLGTSSAIYEKNGDYALGIFTSGWCRFMDRTSRCLCDSDDNQKALACGKWACHESCWTEASKTAIETGNPTDIECTGGIHLYAVPIRAGEEIVGAINFGYGDPPRDLTKLQTLAEKYRVSVEELLTLANAYESRPLYIIDLAKKRLHVSARLIGEIVEKKLAENNLQKLNINLKRSNEDLEQFAYVASHDLQEPLRMVASYTQLLEKRYKDQLDEDARDFINYAVDGARRMQTLINDLLEFSRVSTKGKSFSPLDLSSLLGRVIVTLQHKIHETKALITNDDLPIVTGDESQIMRVFQNLIDNALKFKTAEPPRIHIGSRAEGDNIIISIKDNGIGIDEKYKDRVFTIFQRLHNRTDFPGTGIGLAICKRTIERHGGKIWFESEEGKGTTFFFTLYK